jgi:nicotinamide-nucleotide amidase
MADALYCVAERLGKALLGEGLKAVTAESCTGGWVAQSITAVAGSSAWFDRGFVTYTNDAKRDMLGVTEATLFAHGAVSEATVREMAAGALLKSIGDISVSVSGIAGPAGGTAAKPVGTVWLAWARRGHEATAECHVFSGDREAVRRQAVQRALEGLLELVNKTKL